MVWMSWLETYRDAIVKIQGSDKDEECLGYLCELNFPNCNKMTDSDFSVPLKTPFRRGLYAIHATGSSFDPMVLCRAFSSALLHIAKKAACHRIWLVRGV
jgi:hypothetical protein